MFKINNKKRKANTKLLYLYRTFKNWIGILSKTKKYKCFYRN